MMALISSLGLSGLLYQQRCLTLTFNTGFYLLGFGRVRADLHIAFSVQSSLGDPWPPLRLDTYDDEGHTVTFKTARKCSFD